jgi:hypothetical protein
MVPSTCTLAATAPEQAAAWIWKRSVPVSRTGPNWTATKIGNALFPGLAIRIRQFVTLRWSKAPITVCDSALRRRLPPGKRFFFPQKPPEPSPRCEPTGTPSRLDLAPEFLRHVKALKCSLCQGPERRYRPSGLETNISSPYNPVIPRRVALQQSPLLFHWTRLLSSRRGASQDGFGLAPNWPPFATAASGLSPAARKVEKHTPAP